MIKLLWIFCSIGVFVYTFKACVRSELKTWGRVNADLLILLTLLSFMISLLGPIAIVAFFIYNRFKTMAKLINEGYTSEQTTI